MSKSLLQICLEEAMKSNESLLPPELKKAAKLKKRGKIAESNKITKDYFDNIDKKQIEAKQDEKDRKLKVGKYDPKNIHLGTCRSCEGSIVERIKYKDSNPGLIGPGNRIPIHDCYYCKSCGLMYAFVPA